MRKSMSRQGPRVPGASAIRSLQRPASMSARSLTSRPTAQLLPARKSPRV